MTLKENEVGYELVCLLIHCLHYPTNNKTGQEISILNFHGFHNISYLYFSVTHVFNNTKMLSLKKL